MLQIYDLGVLRKSLIKYDFRKNEDLLDPLKRDIFFEKCIRFAQDDIGLYQPNISSTSISGKQIFSLEDFEYEILQRIALRYLKSIFFVKPSNRNKIIKSLTKTLQSSNQYAIYRCDIKSFYESISRKRCFDLISENNLLSTQTLSIIKKMVDTSTASGLPRGIAASAIMSEIYMKQFDEKMNNDNEVIFYSRFVDDILVVRAIAEEEENLERYLKSIKSRLPEGITLNNKAEKLSIIKTEKNKKSQAISETGKFSYLGYAFTILSSDKKQCHKDERKLMISISDRKIKKIKTRIYKSIEQFNNSPNFELLYDRLQYLTCNFSVWDIKLGKYRNAGIRYNYPDLHDDGRSLINLDKYLISILNGTTQNHSNALRAKLTKAQLKSLEKLSFQRGYENEIFYYFNPSRMSEIKECWKYE